MQFACERQENERQADAASSGLRKGAAMIGLAGYRCLYAVKSQRALRSRRETGFSSSSGSKEAINQ